MRSRSILLLAPTLVLGSLLSFVAAASGGVPSGATAISVTSGSTTVLLLAGGLVLEAGGVLSVGKMAARPGDGVFGPAQLRQRPIQTLPTQLDRQLGSRRVQPGELGLPLVGPQLPGIGARLTVIGAQLAGIGGHLAVIGTQLAGIGGHFAVTDVEGVQLDRRLPHLQRNLAGIGGSLTRRDGPAHSVAARCWRPERRGQLRRGWSPRRPVLVRAPTLRSPALPRLFGHIPQSAVVGSRSESGRSTVRSCPLLDRVILSASSTNGSLIRREGHRISAQ